MYNIRRKKEENKMETKQLKEGIQLHFIKTDKFKTNLIAVFITVPLDRKTVTTDAMIPAILRRGTKKLKTQEEIERHLEELYGARFDLGIEKIGDNHVLKFYLETVSDEFLPEKENVFQKGIETLLDIILNPIEENGSFMQEYVDSEKRNLKQLIESKIDNKASYAVEKTIEAMYLNQPYGLYKYGYAEDLEQMTGCEIYKRYKQILKQAKIDIFASGSFEENAVKAVIENNKQMEQLEGRTPNYIINNEQTAKKSKPETIQEVEESLDVAQGKLILGLDILKNEPNSRFAISLYNVILGESANSKLFQNVREKASLAYSAGSSYIRQKNNILIRTGIEIENKEKALEITKEQLEAMRKGDFTEEDIENAKKYMINGIKTIEEGQDTEITYYIGQELSGLHTSLAEYQKQIEAVSKQDIMEVASKVEINTIYFLKN